ncbi:hypothetical protein LEM8419_00969 [Neolewinella maritima]|uniref:Photosystem II reaction center protein Z n=1 Tax=Neolewinella maritima TaxID=1383882 RepID=A0ABM9AYF9_9BACT|nr:hypothetical protein [Neolewinella maritima]CAH0999669.1 hypothetical protein LEM8419_00969 [Neolewinella maritima]
MDVKKILALVFTVLGAVGLAFGVLAIFNPGQLALGNNAWGVAIVGLIFFITGMSLLRSVK